jgi:hypothetical protein
MCQQQFWKIWQQLQTEGGGGGSEEEKFFHLFYSISVEWRISSHKTASSSSFSRPKNDDISFIKVHLYSGNTSCWGTSWPRWPRKKKSVTDLDAPKHVLTIYITVFVTRGRHFGARESVWSYFFEAKPRKNISKTNSRASKWLPRSQKQCWIKLYLTFGSKMDQYFNTAQGSS